MRPEDVGRCSRRSRAPGYRTESRFPHWLGKAHSGDDFVDIIFSSGNGVATVDDDWFAHAVGRGVLGLAVQLCPVEETIWSKAFVMERERYDGADVAHILPPCAEDARLGPAAPPLRPRTGACCSRT